MPAIEINRNESSILIIPISSSSGQGGVEAVEIDSHTITDLGIQPLSYAKLNSE